MIPALAVPAVLKRIPSWAWIGLGAVMLMVAFYFALDAYGDSRYREGRLAEKAAWEQAEAKFLKKAGDAATKADKQAAAREAEHAATVAEERKKIDEAVQNGSSPFDVLFPSK